MPHVLPRRSPAAAVPSAAATEGIAVSAVGAGASLRELAADAWDDWSTCDNDGSEAVACADASLAGHLCYL